MTNDDVWYLLSFDWIVIWINLWCISNWIYLIEIFHSWTIIAHLIDTINTIWLNVLFKSRTIKWTKF